ncbi:MAG: DUF350 domain-containing protein [Carboxydocellales bacterium]
MNAYVSVIIFFIAVSAVMQVATLLFNLVTKYQIWDEIRQGNVAVALSTGGIILGVANIMHFAIRSNDSLFTTLLWGGFGTLLLLAVYAAFELFTPVLPVSEEIGKGNKAVGLISFFYSLAFSFVIGASIS